MGKFIRTAPIPTHQEIPQLVEERPEIPREKTGSVQIAEKMAFLFQPARYKVAYGGRGGVKSWSFARALLILGAQSSLRILCTREFQVSIRDSVHQLLSDQIKLMEMDGYYEVLQSEIRGVGGTEFIFMGLKQNPNRIKETEGVDICWVEQGEKVSERSWQILIPTIRKPGSEIWVSFNPEDESDPTYKRFITNPPPEFIRDQNGEERRYSYIVETGWRDNPWLPEELRIEKDYLASVDQEQFDHVWGGQIQKKSNAQVMHDKCTSDAFEPDLTLCDCGHHVLKHVDRDGRPVACSECGCSEFVAAWKGPYYGADWGFASDPSVLIKKWIFGPDLYIEKEFWRVGVEIDDLPKKFLEAMPEVAGRIVRADSSRPETISYLRRWTDEDGRQPFSRMIGAEKWPGSVEDGIAFLRKFRRVVIHSTNCPHTSEESRTYKHKVDPLTGDVLPDIVDKNNHCWDSARYGLEPMIRKRSAPGLVFVKAQQAAAEEEKKAEKKKKVENVFSVNAIHGSEARRQAAERWERGE